jgi:hypothetical protein
MRVALFGGTGFIGGRLVEELTGAGHQVSLFVRPRPGRSPRPPVPGVVEVPFDNRPGGAWEGTLAGAEAVVNMAGATIGGRWTADRKRLLVQSRVPFTAGIVAAIGRADPRPRLLVSASGAGYYGDRGEDPLAEGEPPGEDFLSRLAREWEAEAANAEALGLRVVQVRTAIVFGRGGGSLPQLTLPFRLFAGGPLGSGRQWFPWVHLDDIAGIYRHAVETTPLTGPLNAAAGSVRQKELARVIGRILHRPSFLPAPRFALRLALGEFAEAILASQRIDNRKLLASGYRLRHPDLAEALAEALG